MLGLRRSLLRQGKVAGRDIELPCSSVEAKVHESMLRGEHGNVMVVLHQSESVIVGGCHNVAAKENRPVLAAQSSENRRRDVQRTAQRAAMCSMS